MKITKLSQKNEKTVFEISGTTPGYANTIRRQLMTNTPTMAVSKVEIKQNTGALYDEVIAHRLGLLVLSTPTGTYNIPEKNAEESAATHVTLKLKAQGPKTVYASELESSDKNVVPIHPETPLLKLLDGQEVEIVASAHLGKGREHTKWSPCLAHYYYKPKITIDNKSSNLNEVIEKLPSKIVSSGKIDETKIDTPELIDAVRTVDPEVIKVEYPDHQTEFIFTIEAFGQMDAKTMIEQSMNEFNKELDEFKKLVKEL